MKSNHSNSEYEHRMTIISQQFHKKNSISSTVYNNLPHLS